MRLLSLFLAVALCLFSRAPAASAQGDLGSSAAGPSGVRSEAEQATGPPQANTEAEEGQPDALETELAAEYGVSTPPVRYNELNPRITVFGDFVGRLDNQGVVEEGTRVDDRFSLRETELSMQEAVDPFADAALVASFEEQADGETHVHVEEGYVTLKKLPFWETMPGGMKLKVGKFRTAFGRMNLLHTHDLPQTTRPLPVESYLGEEGFAQPGLSANFFLPGGGVSSSWDMTLELLTGGGIAWADGAPNRPGLLGHLRWFTTFDDGQKDLEAGLSAYTGHTDEAGKLSAQLYGFDLSYKWKPYLLGEWRSLVAGAEAFWGQRQAETDGVESTVRPRGGYLFAQYQWDKNLYTGVRLDYAKGPDDDTIDRRLAALYASYYTSEFLRLRLGLEHRWSDLPEEDGRDTLFFETTFVFGEHPAHPWWVAR